MGISIQWPNNIGFQYPGVQSWGGKMAIFHMQFIVGCCSCLFCFCFVSCDCLK